MAVELLVRARERRKWLKGMVELAKLQPCEWGNSERLPRYIKVEVVDAVSLDDVAKYLLQLRNDFLVSEEAGDVVIEAASKTAGGNNSLDTVEVRDFVLDLLKVESAIITATGGVRMELPDGWTADGVKAELVDKIGEAEFAKRRYYLDRTVVDSAVAAGTEITKLTLKELDKKMRDGLSQ